MPVDRIVRSMRGILPNIKYVYLGDPQEVHTKTLRSLTSDCLNVVIRNQSGRCVDELLTFLNTADKTYSIYFLGGGNSKPMLDITIFAKPNVRTVYVRQEM